MSQMRAELTDLKYLRITRPNTMQQVFIDKTYLVYIFYLFTNNEDGAQNTVPAAAISSCTCYENRVLAFKSPDSIVGMVMNKVSCSNIKFLR